MTKDSQQLLFIGKHCSLETCNQNDFLPITVSHLHILYTYIYILIQSFSVIIVKRYTAQIIQTRQ